MELFWIGLNGLDRTFLICALFGALMFVLRGVLALFGGDGDADLGDLDSDAGFRLLSLQGLTGFFVMFGLVGLALHRGSRLGDGISVLGAFAAGVAMMALMAKVTQMMQKLQSSGTIDLKGAVGRTGMVYLSIPKGGGIGKVQVNFENRQTILEALSADKSAIKTGERVEVVELVEGNTLIVKKVESGARQDSTESNA